MFAGMQFAINPLENRFLTKVEVQGIVQPDGPPLIPDISRSTPKGLLAFRQLSAAGGTRAALAEIMER